MFFFLRKLFFDEKESVPCYALYLLFLHATLAVVGLSSTDLPREYFGRRFNQQPIAIFDLPEPPNTGKALVEFFTEMRTLSLRGLFIKDPVRGPWLHKPFLKGHLADAVARYVSGEHHVMQ